MEPSKQPSTEQSKKASGWKITGIILLVLGGLMTLSALRTFASLESSSDGAYQAGRSIGVFLVPIIVIALGYLCLRKAKS